MSCCDLILNECEHNGTNTGGVMHHADLQSCTQAVQAVYVHPPASGYHRTVCMERHGLVIMACCAWCRSSIALQRVSRVYSAARSVWGYL